MSDSPPPEERRPPALRLVGVSKRFGGSIALEGLDLEVGRGEYFCILGPSGSGKSTLLRVIAGFEPPDSGEVHLGGIPADGIPPERRDVNTVFQGYALFPHMSVSRNVGFGLAMKGMAAAEIGIRVEEMLALVGLTGYGPRDPRTLSGGEQQRIALARALVNRPSLLLLDEPLAALDRKLRIRMRDELARIQAETGIAFVHVTHDQEEALRLGDRIAVMERGRFLQVGPPSEVYRRPTSAFVADFLGSANLFRARTVRETPHQIEVADGPVLNVARASHLPRSGEVGGYAVRPEALVPLTGAEGSAGENGENRFRCRVVSRSAVGTLEELRVRVGSEVWTMHVMASRRAPLPDVGEEIDLALDPADVIPLEG